MKLSINDIRIDGGTQPRAAIDESAVSEYVEAMQDGTEFPPVIVFNDGLTYWLADGFHRTHAARRAEAAEIAAEVRQGTRRDAVLYSVGANADHGLRRTNADKRQSVMTLLKDEEWAQWSDRELARRCAVSQPFVSKMRPSLTSVISDAAEKPQRNYSTKHGTQAVMNTSNIGRNRAAEESIAADAEKATPPEQAPTKQRGRAMRHAYEAVATLKRISFNDSLRFDALDFVRDWIEANRDCT